MDEVLEEVATRYRLKWDRSKDWTNAVHLGVNLNSKRQWNLRTNRGKVGFNRIRRLKRLPPAE